MAVGTTTAILLGAGGLAGGFAASKGGLFGGFGKVASQVSAPMPLPQPPSVDSAVDKAADIVKKKRAMASQSVYTSPLGVAGEADVARKTLLGQ